MDEQPQGFTGALEGARQQLEAIHETFLEAFRKALCEAGLAVAEFLEDPIEEEREYEAARRRDIFIARKREKRRRAKLGY